MQVTWFSHCFMSCTPEKSRKKEINFLSRTGNQAMDTWICATLRPNLCRDTSGIVPSPELWSLKMQKLTLHLRFVLFWTGKVGCLDHSNLILLFGEVLWVIQTYSKPPGFDVIWCDACALKGTQVLRLHLLQTSFWQLDSRSSWVIMAHSWQTETHFPSMRCWLGGVINWDE